MAKIFSLTIDNSINEKFIKDIYIKKKIVGKNYETGGMDISPTFLKSIEGKGEFT